MAYGDLLQIQRKWTIYLNETQRNPQQLKYRYYTKLCDLAYLKIIILRHASQMSPSSLMVIQTSASFSPIVHIYLLHRQVERERDVLALFISILDYSYIKPHSYLLISDESVVLCFLSNKIERSTFPFCIFQTCEYVFAIKR